MWNVASCISLQEKDEMLKIKDVFCGFLGGGPGMSEAGLVGLHCQAASLLCIINQRNEPLFRGSGTRVMIYFRGKKEEKKTLFEAKAVHKETARGDEVSTQEQANEHEIAALLRQRVNNVTESYNGALDDSSLDQQIISWSLRADSFNTHIIYIYIYSNHFFPEIHSTGKRN